MHHLMPGCRFVLVMQPAADLDEAVAKAWARADITPIASCYCHPEARLRQN
jgi:hypothetical protein